MLFMVIERFRPDQTDAVGARFKEKGRMMPEGVTYVASWIETAAPNRCFQIMQADSSERLSGWTKNWDDIVEFEVIPVLTSADYWAAKR